jgi:hypothetical protein
VRRRASSPVVPASRDPRDARAAPIDRSIARSIAAAPRVVVFRSCDPPNVFRALT